MCNCSSCGREMPLGNELEPLDAVNAQCEQCQAHGAEEIDEEFDDQLCAPSSQSSRGWLSGMTGAVGSGLGALASLLSSTSSSSSSSSSLSSLAAPIREDEMMFARALGSSVAWHEAWNAIRNAPTLADCRRQLTLLVKHNPSFKDYSQYLWRNVGMWAVCCFVWTLTFG